MSSIFSFELEIVFCHWRLLCNETFEQKTDFYNTFIEEQEFYKEQGGKHHHPKEGGKQHRQKQQQTKQPHPKGEGGTSLINRTLL